MTEKYILEVDFDQNFADNDFTILLARGPDGVVRLESDHTVRITPLAEDSTYDGYFRALAERGF